MSSDSSAMDKKLKETEAHDGGQARPISWKDKRLWALIIIIFLVCVGIGVGVGVGVTRNKEYTHHVHFSRLRCLLINGAAKARPTRRPWTVL